MKLSQKLIRFQRHEHTQRADYNSLEITLCLALSLSVQITLLHHFFLHHPPSFSLLGRLIHSQEMMCAVDERCVLQRISCPSGPCPPKGVCKKGTSHASALTHCLLFLSFFLRTVARERSITSLAWLPHCPRQLLLPSQSTHVSCPFFLVPFFCHFPLVPSHF